MFKAALGLIALLGVSAVSATSHAAYNCGTGWTAYAVTDGVRCVQFVPAQGARPKGYVVYGEGRNNGSFLYRHIAAVRQVGTSNNYTGSVTDINGNGEAYSSYLDGTFTMAASDSSQFPPSFAISPWGETWTKVGSGQTSNPNYTTVFAVRPRFCGSTFWGGNTNPKLRQYRVYRYNGALTEAISGLACTLSLDSGTAPHQFDVALGSGVVMTRSSVGTPDTPPVPWVEANYMNVAVRQTTSYGQWDLCQLSSTCVARSFGSVTAAQETLSDTGNGVSLSGAGAQTLWIPFIARIGVRVLGLDVHNDNGSEASRINPDDLLTYVQWANFVHNSNPTQGIQLLYNRVYPGTNVDFSVTNNSALNGAGADPQYYPFKNPSTNQETFAYGLADWYAQLVPDHAVSVYTRGPFTGTQCSHKGGFSDGNLRFAVIPAPEFNNENCRWNGCDNQLGDLTVYAHEIGHFFGLSHTFPKEFGSVTEAAAYWQCDNSSTSTTMDGDYWLGPSLNPGDDDTLADPLISTNKCLSNKSSETLWWGFCTQSFQLPRTNIMSYYLSPLWPFDKVITNHQRDRMFLTMQGMAFGIVEDDAVTGEGPKKHRKRLY